MTLEKLKSDIAALGFKMSTKTLSWGPQNTYVHKETKEKLNFNVFTPETIQVWKPLIDYLRDNRESIQALRKETGIYGLVK